MSQEILLAHMLLFHRSQHPQCEGVSDVTNRFPFQTVISDGPYIHGEKVNDQVVIYAGKHAGATTGALFDIYAYPSSSDSTARLKLAQLAVSKDGDDDDSAYLANPSSVTLPDSFCAKLAGLNPASRLRVYLSDPDIWSCLSEEDKAMLIGFTEQVDTEDKAQFVATLQEDGGERKASFKWTKLGDNNLKDIPVGKLGVLLSDTRRLVAVFIAAARFRYYLNLPQEDPDNRPVRVSMTRLKSGKQPGVPFPVMVKYGEEIQPVGPEKGTFKLELKPGANAQPMGVTLKNTSEYEGYYPHVFLFEPTTLEIGELFKSD